MTTLQPKLGAASFDPGAASARSLVAELFTRERRLALFATLMLALLLPLAIAWGLDDRTLRSANIWIKPIKFAASLALLAITVGWFIGHLPPDKRQTRAVDWIVWLLIGSASFEIGYIVLQAALGQGSHFNVADPLHATLYSLMGVGALILTATQPLLAWRLHKHGSPGQPAVYSRSVKLGLVLAFVLGTSSGVLLSGMQPPDGGAVVPFVGWSLAGGDLRPAHFVGLHAAQLLPLLGLALLATGWRKPGRWLAVLSTAYVLLFVVLFFWGLSGRV